MSQVYQQIKIYEILNSLAKEEKKEFVKNYICAECKTETAEMEHMYNCVPFCSEECYDKHFCKDHTVRDHWKLEFLCECCMKHNLVYDYEERNIRGSCSMCNESRYCCFCLQRHTCKQDKLVKEPDGSIITLKEYYRREAIKKKYSDLRFERDKSKKELLELSERIKKLDNEIKGMKEKNKDILFFKYF